MAAYSFITLATKPSASISYRFLPTKPHVAGSQALLVFLNGLGLPQAGWDQVIDAFRQTGNEIAILTYDRFGQGATIDRDPSDEDAEDPMHGHDCMSVVHDLRQLLTQIMMDRLNQKDVDAVPLVFVANSIGCAIARLYAQQFPGTVAGLLLLDSVLANSDFVSMFPDPDSEDFDANRLPAGVTPEGLRTIRAGCLRIFHPKNGSKEGLSRKSLKHLLPASDGPLLKGPDGHGPYVTVVGHDFETFAEESAKMGFPKACTIAYSNPYWHEYNEGLTKITTASRARGPLIAAGAGHFIQKDNPSFVCQELLHLLQKVRMT